VVLIVGLLESGEGAWGWRRDALIRATSCSLDSLLRNVLAQYGRASRLSGISLRNTNDEPQKMRTPASKPQLDAIDRQILVELQTDGRLSNVQLAERVHLSPSACLRRVKQVEETGVIGQYVALLNPKALGQHGTCFSIINLQTMSDGVLKGFEQAVRDEPEILDCFYVAGSNDYLIRFSYRDAEDLERFHTQVLMRLPGVERSNSMLVLRTVKKTTALPV
jgi:DNA-binding Lrp family transcriptional regulator